MFRISVVDEPSERKLILEGKLTSPFVSELRNTWAIAQTNLGGRVLVIDMTDVTFIGHEEEDVLLELVNKGAKFRSRGVLTKHVLQQLMRRAKTHGGDH